VKTRILLAALIGFLVFDAWMLIAIRLKYHPGYPGMVMESIFFPGIVFFGMSIVGRFVDAVVYAGITAIASLIATKLRPA
jgi:hypothetical protein